MAGAFIIDAVSKPRTGPGAPGTGCAKIAMTDDSVAASYPIVVTGPVPVGTARFS